jgi:LDH2 family malate/lactate/ureidoglycolate dehydrogenase
MHPAEGFDTIKIPGDRGLEKMKEIMQQGELEVDYKMVRELEELAA